MLVKDHNALTRPIADALQRYLENTLHVPARIVALELTAVRLSRLQGMLSSDVQRPTADDFQHRASNDVA